MGKRLFDLLLAVVLSPVVLPAIGVIAGLVKITDPGPAFYRGTRSGLHGKPFRIFKMRTMVVNAENLGGGTTALNDPRVTRVGLRLRRYKLDELPQLFNVFVGDMSFVGPRPELPRYTEQYAGREKIILSVKPGITDLGSLAYHSLDEVVGDDNADEVYEREVLEHKNQLRIEYVETRSWWLDLQILGRTGWLALKKLTTQGPG